MTVTELQRIDVFQRIGFAFSGRVLPAFGIACRFLTFGCSNNGLLPVVFVSKRIGSVNHVLVHVIRRTNLAARRTESTPSTATKSP